MPHSLHRFLTIWPEFWAWLKNPVEISRRELAFENSTFNTQYGHCMNLVGLSADWCVECKKGYCTACWARRKIQSADAVGDGKSTDVEHRPTTTEYNKQSSQSTPSNIAMSLLQPFRIGRSVYRNPSNAYRPSPVSHSSTSPARLHYQSPGNIPNLECPESTATMRPTSPRNLTDDLAAIYPSPAFSRSNERLLPAPLGSFTPSQHAREPTPSPPSTPRITTSLFE